MINFSGVFQPADGQPPRAVETVTLAIYAEPTGGAPLWQETQSVGVDARALLRCCSARRSPRGIPPAALRVGRAGSGTHFERPGEVEGPRVLLASVPYALRAADADTLGGRPGLGVSARAGRRRQRNARARTPRREARRPSHRPRRSLSPARPTSSGSTSTAPTSGTPRSMRPAAASASTPPRPFDFLHVQLHQHQRRR